MWKTVIGLALSFLGLCASAQDSPEVSALKKLVDISVRDAPSGSETICWKSHCKIKVHVVSIGHLNQEDRFVCRTFLEYEKIFIKKRNAKVTWVLERTQKGDTSTYQFFDGKFPVLDSEVLFQGIFLGFEQKDFDGATLNGNRYTWTANKGNGIGIPYYMMVRQFDKHGNPVGVCQPNDPIIVNQS